MLNILALGVSLGTAQPIHFEDPNLSLFVDCGYPLACDCDENSFVDYYDLALLSEHGLSRWCWWGGCLAVDLNEDNAVDLDDFKLLAAHWLDNWNPAPDLVMAVSRIA